MAVLTEPVPTELARRVTYSPAYTLVPTYECFNRCSYCNFRVEPGRDRWLPLDEARARLAAMGVRGICEVLLLSGEVHPQSARRAAWLEQIVAIARLALEMGFLPHANVGPLSREEMRSLGAVTVSMGLMLEQLADLPVHRFAPSKVASVRVEQLDLAGELRIPFTTGLLLGIGETDEQREDTLQAIAAAHARCGHIQEVILQPHCPGSRETFAGEGFDLAQLPEVVQQARSLLPPEIVLQIPPNLARDGQVLLSCLEAGARDLGGIVPLDEVNPDYPHAELAELETLLAAAGWELVPRLPVYPQFVDWLEGGVRSRVKQWQFARAL